jgi:hypothetical protein
VTAILANPRYTGRQVRNRQRTDHDLADPANTGLGHRQVQRWNLSEGWVISKLPRIRRWSAKPTSSLPRTPPRPAAQPGLPPAGTCWPGLLACGRCGRRLESAWSNGKPAYRCRHGHTTATRPEPSRVKNTYIREEQILPHMAAVAILLGRDQVLSGHAAQITSPDEAAALSSQLRTAGITMTYDPDTRTLHTSDSNIAAVAVS